MNVSRLIVAGLSGDSGKTLVSLSLIEALRRLGLSVSVFKKGPDYIDAAWLSWASGTPCRNLDTFMAGEDAVVESFAAHAAASDIAVVEGNRGLYDGSDAEGTHSTATLARLLGAPIVLVADCTKTTRTIAALIHGCMAFEQDLDIAGVILNQIAGKRHESVIRESVEQTCGVPVLGAIPRHGSDAGLIPGRHLGLVTPAEFDAANRLRERLQAIGAQHLDIEGVREVAGRGKPLKAAALPKPEAVSVPIRVGYFRDAVFTFYYPENLEALERCGAELAPVSSLDDSTLPVLDALYIGGGFPEVHAERLTQNQSMLRAVRQASADGLPIYAECGGLIYLSRSMTCDDRRYAMAGVFDIDLCLDAKPAGHGYATVRIDGPCPFFASGTQLRGHEFHYSRLIDESGSAATCMAVERGSGIGDRRDGLVKDNTLACYMHLHAVGNSQWADAIVRRAREYRTRRESRGLTRNIDRFETPRLGIALSTTPVNG